MGYYSEYFSTIFKGVRATAFKQRREARRVVNNLKAGSDILYKSLFEKVEREHRVTKAISLEERLINKLEKSMENAYALFYNAETQESSLLETVGQILSELEEFSRAVDRLKNPLTKAGVYQDLHKVRHEFALAIFQGLKKGEAEEREEMKPVMLIINMAEEGRNKLMEAARLAFRQKTMQTILARFAIRRESSIVKNDILRLKKVRYKIIGLRKAVEGDKNLKNVVVGLMEEKQHLKYLTDAFYETYLLKKRDVLLILKALFDLNTLRRFNNIWMSKSYMPEQAVRDKNAKIENAESKMSHHFHVIAQAFRIMISKLDKLEKIAEAMGSN